MPAGWLLRLCRAHGGLARMGDWMPGLQLLRSCSSGAVINPAAYRLVMHGPRTHPIPQGYELLAQEVREAFLNARLADHAGEPWARLDVAGCELRPGSAHAEALAQVGLSRLPRLGPLGCCATSGRRPITWAAHLVSHAPN